MVPEWWSTLAVAMSAPSSVIITMTAFPQYMGCRSYLGAVTREGLPIGFSGREFSSPFAHEK